MKRLGAILVAVAMVGAAWWVRTSFIDDDSGGGNAGGERLDLLCGSELADVCERLAAEDESLNVTIADDGDTADRLSTKRGTADFDAWLSAGPWPAIVADNRAAAGLRTDPLGGTSHVLGRSPVTLVGPTDRVEALEQDEAPFRLELSGRYTHSDGHVRAALAAAGFAPPRLQAVVPREEAGREVRGWLAAARRSLSSGPA